MNAIPLKRGSTVFLFLCLNSFFLFFFDFDLFFRSFSPCPSLRTDLIFSHLFDLITLTSIIQIIQAYNQHLANLHITCFTCLLSYFNQNSNNCTETFIEKK